MTELNMAEAINRALTEEMERDDDIIVLGQDIGVDGGVFRITDGLLDKYGERRVIDTPVAESGIVGLCIGMAAGGLSPVCEMQFSGFAYMGLHQLEMHASRFRWRTRGRYPMPITVRVPFGAGVHALEHHSDSKEVFYAHIPGLKMVVPSGPRNTRALMLSAIRDPDPVVFFEPKATYRAFREEVPDEEETLPLGTSRTAREGDDLTMISYGAMLHRVLEAAETLSADDGVEAEVIDLLSLSPLDHERFAESARRTGRVLVVHEAHRSYGPAGEIIARLNEESFWYLEAPIRRVTGFDTHVPYFAREQAYLPSVDGILDAARATLDD
ncbi:alpha-ketoacid dehydrogenase subunit beta [Marinobacter halodurans]|uniref:Alpha-ketoacid dehydrogenase subunit beta n=1 Tax=Marinobacter halodurans TaxID=2528979 RepID=A0ABY1ZH95_9GAMM|nr:alpha-ketoacid dehydrogenase subunit beta [Marinobacter halodurans]TBW49383.1 alpha-ketoacid dehydrogenase subunit beta [Marinobacter halodurans]